MISAYVAAALMSPLPPGTSKLMNRQIEQRQAATDRPADRAFERELVVLPIDDLERVDPLITGAGLGVQGVEPLLPLGYEMLVAVSSLACPRQRYPFRLGASLPSVLFLIYPTH